MFIKLRHRLSTRKLCFLILGPLLAAILSFLSGYHFKLISDFHAFKDLITELQSSKTVLSSLGYKKRTAYVVTLDRDSARFRQTSQILSNMGFHVFIVNPHPFGSTAREKTLSNKIALLKAVEHVLRDQAPWGYVFEDDIVEHELSRSSLTTFVRAEANATLFQYLGICTTLSSSEVSPMCGRCAHAMGFSKRGAEQFLTFSRQRQPVLARGNSPIEEEYVDVIVDSWCQLNNGFQVVGPLQPSKLAVSPGHLGVFIQDRKNFPSEIDSRKEAVDSDSVPR